MVLSPNPYPPQIEASAPNPKNWRRGCFRLWIVGSALFIVAIAGLTSSEIKVQFGHLDLLALQSANVRNMLLNGIGIAVGVPLAVLMMGMAIGWALSGFKDSAPTVSRNLYRRA